MSDMAMGLPLYNPLYRKPSDWRTVAKPFGGASGMPSSPYGMAIGVPGMQSNLSSQPESIQPAWINRGGSLVADNEEARSYIPGARQKQDVIGALKNAVIGATPRPQGIPAMGSQAPAVSTLEYRPGMQSPGIKTMEWTPQSPTPEIKTLEYRKPAMGGIPDMATRSTATAFAPGTQLGIPDLAGNGTQPFYATGSRVPWGSRLAYDNAVSVANAGAGRDMTNAKSQANAEYLRQHPSKDPFIAENTELNRVGRSLEAVLRGDFSFDPLEAQRMAQPRLAIPHSKTPEELRREQESAQAAAQAQAQPIIDALNASPNATPISEYPSYSADGKATRGIPGFDAGQKVLVTERGSPEYKAYIKAAQTANGNAEGLPALKIVRPGVNDTPENTAASWDATRKSVAAASKRERQRQAEKDERYQLATGRGLEAIMNRERQGIPVPGSMYAATGLPDPEIAKMQGIVEVAKAIAQAQALAGMKEGTAMDPKFLERTLQGVAGMMGNPRQMGIPNPNERPSGGVGAGQGVPVSPNSQTQVSSVPELRTAVREELRDQLDAAVLANKPEEVARIALASGLTRDRIIPVLNSMNSWYSKDNPSGGFWSWLFANPAYTEADAYAPR
jgi:hypothetical protein